MQPQDGHTGQADKEFQRLRRALKTLSAINHAVLHAEDEASLLFAICRVIVEDAGYRLAWVSRIEQDEKKTLRPVAHWGGDECLLEIRRTWADSEQGRGPNPTAIRTGKPCVLRNVLTDPDYSSWREECIKRGYASIIVLPLFVDGEIFGSLTIYAPDPEAFNEEEVNLLSAAADDLGYGIAALRARAQARQAEETVRRMAYYDSLTGLPNRVRLRELLGHAITTAKQQKQPLSLLMLDMGNFQEINETLGYREGDRLLQEIARHLVKTIGEAGTIARVGESEFVILLPQSGSETATRFATKILVALYEPVELAGFMLDPRASIGITLFPGHGTDPDALMRRAGVALHQAKRSGGGYAIYAGGLDKDNTRRLALMGDLRRAIDNNELRLYCQPKVHIPSASVYGAEALVRWQHPEQGIVNPGEFIRLAERTGLITPLTYWMLDAALSQSYGWREGGLIMPLSVNLSARDLRDPRLLDRIKGSFTTWGAEPDWIQFELTESALMEDPAGSLATLLRLKDLGVELSIDDYGTGYSSLSYLQKLPVDFLKIDQSFVGAMTKSNDSAIIVHSTIELAHNLDLGVIAEGVENQEIWERLAKLGCDFAQGYSISKPIPADEFKDWKDHSRWAVKKPEGTA